MQDGFSQCKNKNYFQKDEIFVYYNNIMKVWIRNKI